MKIPKNLNGLLVGVAVVVVFTVGAFFALGVKSVLTSTATAQISVPNPGHNYDQIALPEGTWPNLDADKLDGYDSADFGGGGGCYTNWNSADCAPGWTAVSTGEWTGIVMSAVTFGGATFICASPKVEDEGTGVGFRSDTYHDNLDHLVRHEPCAICCK